MLLLNGLLLYIHASLPQRTAKLKGCAGKSLPPAVGLRCPAAD